MRVADYIRALRAILRGLGQIETDILRQDHQTALRRVQMTKTAVQEALDDLEALPGQEGE